MAQGGATIVWQSWRRCRPLQVTSSGGHLKNAYAELVSLVSIHFLFWFGNGLVFFPFKHFTRTEKTIRNLNGNVIRKYADGDGVVSIFLAAGKVEPWGLPMCLQCSQRIVTPQNLIIGGHPARKVCCRPALQRNRKVLRTQYVLELSKIGESPRRTFHLAIACYTAALNKTILMRFPCLIWTMECYQICNFDWCHRTPHLISGPEKCLDAFFSALSVALNNNKVVIPTFLKRVSIGGEAISGPWKAHKPGFDFFSSYLFAALFRSILIAIKSPADKASIRVTTSLLNTTMNGKWSWFDCDRR